MSPLASSIRFLQTQPDARLIELSQAGHERAFEALVHRYRRELLAYCRRLTRSESSAEDVLQQGLLQAWIAISRDAEVRDVRAWLYRIVHNVAISDHRRLGAESVELDGNHAAGGAEFEAERRLAVREALAGLAALPELQRRVMLSTALEGRSHEEIAAALGLSHGAVRGLIFRARAALRAAAAAIIPGPVVGWAVRQEVRGGAGSQRFYETMAGGGTAGVGGLLLKGGALVAISGALATAAGLNPINATHHRHMRAQSSGLFVARSAPGASRTAAVFALASHSLATPGLARGGAGQQRSSAAPAGGRFRSGSSTSGSAPSRRGSPSSGGGETRQSGGRDGGTGSTSGSSGASGGTDGGSSGGETSGSSGGTPETGTSSASSGGSSGGTDGGSSGTSTTTEGGGSASSGGSDGGSTSGGTSGSDGGTAGGSDGTTTITTTSGN